MVSRHLDIPFTIIGSITGGLKFITSMFCFYMLLLTDNFPVLVDLALSFHLSLLLEVTVVRHVTDDLRVSFDS